MTYSLPTNKKVVSSGTFSGDLRYAEGNRVNLTFDGKLRRFDSDVDASFRAAVFDLPKQD